MQLKVTCQNFGAVFTLRLILQSSAYKSAHPCLGERLSYQAGGSRVGNFLFHDVDAGTQKAVIKEP